MTGTDLDLARALQDTRLLDELHAFLWTDPFLDGGTADDGWSSREHAVVVGQMLVDLGADVRIRHGKCMFIQGPGSGGAPAVGLGQQVVYLIRSEEPITADIARAGLAWAGSRVSQRLAQRGLPDDVYVRLAAHVRGVAAGTRRPLGALSRNRAWSIVAGDRELDPAAEPAPGRC